MHALGVKKKVFWTGDLFLLFAKHAPRSFDMLFILEASNRTIPYNPNKGYISPAAEMSAAIDVQDVTGDRRSVGQIQDRSRGGL